VNLNHLTQKSQHALPTAKQLAVRAEHSEIGGAAARTGRMDPVIGRDGQIRRVVRVLSRGSKNGPVLIGRPRRRKTAIVEGLARRIVDGDVPEGLRDRTIFAMDPGLPVAGAKYRGEFEERLPAVLSEIEAAEGLLLLKSSNCHEPLTGITDTTDDDSTDVVGRASLPVDVGRSSTKSQQFEVQAVPALIVSHGGSVVAREPGMMPITAPRERIPEALPPADRFMPLGSVS
jgi:hypothetical protein